MTENSDPTIQVIKQQLANSKVVLYMKGTPQFPQCGFSARAVQVLQQCNAVFETVNILENPDIRRVLPSYSNWPTFPQLFIKGELVGGSDIMLELFQSGELQKQLAEVVN
jgi:monothiol glutaredoxin